MLHADWKKVFFCGHYWNKGVPIAQLGERQTRDRKVTGSGFVPLS